MSNYAKISTSIEGVSNEEKEIATNKNKKLIHIWWS